MEEGMVVVCSDEELHKAVKENRKSDILKMLNKDPALVNAFDKHQQSPLHIACSRGYKDLVLLFIQRNANIHILDKNNWSPLHCAANNGFLEVCKILLERGADARIPTDAGTTVLHYLVRHDCPDTSLLKEVIYLILERGGDVDCQNKYGETALHQAVMRGKLQNVTILLELHAGVDLTNRDGETGLHFAARTGFVEIAKLMLNAGADPQIRGDYGDCINVAVSSNQTEMIDLLTKHLEAQSKKKRTTVPLGSEPTLGHKDKMQMIGPKGLPPRSRRFRHIAGLLCRNLIHPDGIEVASSQKLLHAYYALHEKSEEPPFYISEVAKCTLNPTWRNILRENFFDKEFQPGQCYQFFVKVWNCNTPDGNPILVFEQPLDLNNLGYVGPGILLYSALPRNTLVFQLHDGLYVLEETIYAMKGFLLPKPSPLVGRGSRSGSIRTKTCSFQEIVKLINVKNQLQELQDREKALRSTIERKHNKRMRYLELLSKRDALRLHKETLQAEYDEWQQELKEGTEKVKEERATLIPRARAVCQAQMQLLEAKTKLGEDQKLLELDKSMLEAITMALEKRRWTLISQLLEVYPIHISEDSRTYAICGMKLPNSEFVGCEEEEVATALGSVCHVVQLISKYLGVPLRYPMTPMCSRSHIEDEISLQLGAAVRYPLYPRGVPFFKFEVGVFLLNKNIEQLLNSRGWDVITLKHTLPNLQNLVAKGQFMLDVSPTGRARHPALLRAQSETISTPSSNRMLSPTSRSLTMRPTGNSPGDHRRRSISED